MAAPRSLDADAVDYLLRRISVDGKLAYLLGHTQALTLLLTARAARDGRDAGAAIRDFHGNLETTPVIVREQAEVRS